jgi:CBS domain-containing protein
MLVGEIMTRSAVTVRDDASAQVALRLLAQRGFTMLPVLDAEDRLVGVVSEADLLSLPEPLDPRAHLRPVSHGAPSGVAPTVATVMTTGPTWTSEHADVAEVADLFRRTAWKCLPVMRGEELVGVVSRSDIIRMMSRDDDDVEDDVNQLLRDLQPDWKATVTNGIATLVGGGSHREADAAASLAATVIGIRGVIVPEPDDHPVGAGGGLTPSPDGSSMRTRRNLDSSGTAVDQL